MFDLAGEHPLNVDVKETVKEMKPTALCLKCQRCIAVLTVHSLKKELCSPG